MSVFKVRFQTPEGRLKYCDGIKFRSRYWLAPRWNLTLVRGHRTPAWIALMKPFEPRVIFELDARYSLGLPVPEVVLTGPPEAAQAAGHNIVIAPIFVVPVDDALWIPR